MLKKNERVRKYQSLFFQNDELWKDMEPSTQE